MNRFKRIDTFNVFGVEVIKCFLKQGDSYSYYVLEDTLRENLPSVYLKTLGKVKVVHNTTGTEISERPLGILLSEVSGTALAGMYTTTALEDTTWWCVRVNRKYKLKSISLEPGQSMTLLGDTALLSCLGSVTYLDKNLPEGYHDTIKAGTVIRAASKFYGIIFETV